MSVLSINQHSTHNYLNKHSGFNNWEWKNEQRNFANYRGSIFRFFNLFEPEIFITLTFKRKDFRSEYITEFRKKLNRFTRNFLRRKVEQKWVIEYGGKKGRPHFHVTLEVRDVLEHYEQELRIVFPEMWPHGNRHLEKIKTGEHWDVMWYLASHGKPRDPKKYKNDLKDIKRSHGGTRPSYALKKSLWDYIGLRGKVSMQTRYHPENLTNTINELRALEKTYWYTKPKGKEISKLEEKETPLSEQLRTNFTLRPCLNEKQKEEILVGVRPIPSCSGVCPRCKEYYQINAVVQLIERIEQVCESPLSLGRFLGDQTRPVASSMNEPQIKKEETLEMCHWLLPLQQKKYHEILYTLRSRKWDRAYGIQDLHDLLRKSILYDFDLATNELREFATQLGRYPKFEDFYDREGKNKGYR
ncbi:MAG: hypothetical protein ACFFBD_17085 [Candidatus Hodarchaeota archaeon]